MDEQLRLRIQLAIIVEHNIYNLAIYNHGQCWDDYEENDATRIYLMNHRIHYYYSFGKKQIATIKKIDCVLNQIFWKYISEKDTLSENFIREFKDKVDWKRISLYQKLSENFIREFQDRVDWRSIFLRQKLSEDFIREFKDRINWRSILLNPNLSDRSARKLFVELLLHRSFEHGYLEETWALERLIQ